MITVKLKKPEQIESMRKAGRLVRLVLEHLREMTRPGTTTAELNAEAERICSEHGAQCLFKGVPSQHGTGPFPGAICASINEQIVHGIPSDRVIRDGDIVSIDFGVRLDGWCGDAAETFIVGQVPPQTRRLVDATRNSLGTAIAMIQPGMMWSTVAAAIQACAESEGFSVVRELTGHGIGRQMWEEPSVPNYWGRKMEAYDFQLTEGLVIAVEPMINMGTAKIKCLRDGWTIVTADNKPSAHFENTLAVTATGVEVLTSL